MTQQLLAALHCLQQYGCQMHMASVLESEETERRDHLQTLSLKRAERGFLKELALDGSITPDGSERSGAQHEP
jgi:hypothetical protein